MTSPTHTLLITDGKRNQLQPKFGSDLGGGVGVGSWHLPVPQHPFCKVLLEEKWGSGERSHQVCVSKYEI